MIIKAIIVDDEEYSRDNLKSLIDKFCSHIQIQAIAASAASARKIIKEYRPDVVFLDINMPNEDGFGLLAGLSAEDYRPLVVFVTAYDQYAIKAIKAKAFDYILKPIDIDELVACEQQLLIAMDPGYQPDRKVRRAEVPAIDTNGKISISHAKGIKLLYLESILYFEADSNYTFIHIKNETNPEKLLVSRNLGYYENLLPENEFFRIHYSFIINIGHMKEYINTNNGYVVMSNGTTIELSRRRSGTFRQFLREHNKIKG